MQAKIGKLIRLTRISQKKLSNFPQFLRFNTVELSYAGGFIRIARKTIAKKCQCAVKHLEPLKAALKDSNLIFFVGKINQEKQEEFKDHLQLVAHLRDDMLEIWNLSRHYKFRIDFNSDNNAAANVITSILEIVHGTNLEIELRYVNPSKLPVDSIAKWLNQKDSRIGMTGQKKEEKFLKIEMERIQNCAEMCGHLAEVVYFIIILNFLLPDFFYN